MLITSYILTGYCVGLSLLAKPAGLSKSKSKCYKTPKPLKCEKLLGQIIRIIIFGQMNRKIILEKGKMFSRNGLNNY